MKYLTVTYDVTGWSQNDITDAVMRTDVRCTSWNDVFEQRNRLEIRVDQLEADLHHLAWSIQVHD